MTTPSDTRRQVLSRLDAGEVLLFDGGLGTELYNRGVFINVCYDELNLTRADLLREVHRDYVDAGADFVETNTYGANRHKLTRFGLADKVREINVAGARLAREAVDASPRQGVLVMGSMGRVGVELTPLGKLTPARARDLFSEQVDGLLDGGVDGLILETFTNPDELLLALEVVRERCPEHLVVTLVTVGEAGSTVFGTPIEAILPRLVSRGADIVGINCSVGPVPMLEVLARMREATRAPLCLQPNAGVPSHVDGRNLYLCSPEFLAEYAGRFIRTGANVLGGCCGTTPDHIRAIRNAIRALKPVQRVGSKGDPGGPLDSGARQEEARPLGERSRFGRALEEGGYPISVELTPPRGHLMGRLLKKARELAELGVTCINIPDGPRAMARMSALATAVRIQDVAGVDVLLHYACRDRNLLGMQSDLLGAHALGIRNVLAVTGDPPKMGTYPEATAVFDVDSVGLTHLVRQLNRGTDLGQAAIGKPTSFVVGVGVNPGALAPDTEIEHFRRKLDMGAEFAITQPVFDVAALLRFLDRLEQLGLRRVPILAGVWPLATQANAEFLNSEIPGVTVPEALITRMARAEEAGVGAETGVEIARDLIEAARPAVDGIQLSTPGGRIDLVRMVLAS